mgnify:CR=1 FL=1
MTYSGAIAGGMPNDPNQNIGSGSAIPGIEVTTSPGLLNEDITINTTSTEPNITFTPDPTGDVNFTVDPAAFVSPAGTDPEVLRLLGEVNTKLDHLLEHAHAHLHGTIHIAPGTVKGAPAPQ